MLYLILGYRGEDCCRMVQTTIKEEHLPRGMNKGLVALLHIGGEKENLGNWLSISFLIF